MKKIYSFLAIFALLLSGMASCGDNTDVWSEHNLTQEEIDELARQDSIKKANQENINANLILRYDVAITISTASYDGATVAIDVDAIAEAFGITTEQLLLGIAGESGAPEIAGFAIQGTGHADLMEAANTNSTWGHWWDAKGDVTTWGSETSPAMVFAEFNTETGAFAVGQYPGRLTDGQKVEFIECLKYNEVRVAVVITATANAMGEVSATIVNTQELSINVNPRAGYDADPLAFDWDQTMSDLGISSPGDVSFIAVNSDGSYAQEPNAGNGGYWYDLEGYAGQWGDNASVYTSFDTADDGSYNIGIGQYPNQLSEGDVITVYYGFLANNKIEMLKITVNVVGYQDSETPPAGEPKSVEKDIQMTKAWDDTYSNIQIDVKDILRDAFKMTTYQIYSAILSGELKIYMGEVTDEAPSYTADSPGYWILADGAAGAWADGLIWLSLGHSETDLYLYGGNHPGNAVAGDVITTKMIIACNGVEVTFNVEYKLTDPE